ncbi:methionine ABC transporter permease [Clostridium sp.]|uniref:methionine ABC transporter permease n=1 Tax=Clostridium sp. TaxID=1506 RepID=UPI0032180587
MKSVLIKSLIETLIMVAAATVFAVVIGMILAIILVLTDNEGPKPNKVIYKTLDVIINTLRSFPFVILMVVVVPITRAIVGKSIGTVAAIVPLTIATAPFVARIIEGSLKEVDKGIIEAAKSLGATKTQIIFKIMLKEAFPSIISGLTLTIISIIGYSAMAGSIGGGGLGAAAITYGYNRFNTEFMVCTVIVLIALVQLIQTIGNYIYKKLS